MSQVVGRWRSDRYDFFQETLHLMNAFMPSRLPGRPTPASRRAFLGGLVAGLPFIIAACGGTEAPAASPTSAPAPSTPAASVRPPTPAPSAATPVPSAAILEKELVIYSSRKESLMEMLGWLIQAAEPIAAASLTPAIRS